MIIYPVSLPVLLSMANCCNLLVILFIDLSICKTQESEPLEDCLLKPS